MKHVFRFIGKCGSDGSWEIDDPTEIEHARKVLRLKAGDPVEVFDGCGAFGNGTVAHVAQDRISVAVEETKRQKAAALKVRLAIGALKPGDLDEVLPALVELGVDDVLVFLQEGTEKFRLADKAVARWEKIVLTATKQCKRPWFPKILTFESLDALLKDEQTARSVRLTLQPHAPQSLMTHDLGVGAVTALLGGERGLSLTEEKMLCDAGFKGVRMGEGILRARTAAIAAAAILGNRRDDVPKDEV